MKKIISILMLVSMIVTGLESYKLFRLFDYKLSELLIIASYMSIVLCIYTLTLRKRKNAFE